MARSKRKHYKARKRRGTIKLSSRARIVEKNDATMVARRDTATYQRMAVQMPRSNGAVFKVKLKKK